jgi:hypothetical protein
MIDRRALWFLLVILLGIFTVIGLFFFLGA